MTVTLECYLYFLSWGLCSLTDSMMKMTLFMVNNVLIADRDETGATMNQVHSEGNMMIMMTQAIVMIMCSIIDSMMMMTLGAAMNQALSEGSIMMMMMILAVVTAWWCDAGCCDEQSSDCEHYDEDCLSWRTVCFTFTEYLFLNYAGFVISNWNVTTCERLIFICILPDLSRTSYLPLGADM